MLQVPLVFDVRIFHLPGFQPGVEVGVQTDLWADWRLFHTAAAQPSTRGPWEIQGDGTAPRHAGFSHW